MTAGLPLRLAGLIVLMFFQASCGTLSSRVLYDSEDSVRRLRAGADLNSEVDRLVIPLIQNGDTLGMVVGVVTPEGDSRYFSYGNSGWAGQPLSKTSLFQVGSVSKLFVASVLAILVREGRLRYEETVREILPPEIKVSADAGALTLYELVTHTGGLPRESHGYPQFRDFVRYLFTGKNLYRYLNKDYLYRYLRVCKIKPKEKRRYQYSNIGAALLAHLIEIKTGKPFPVLAEENIFVPLKMKDSVFFPAEEQKKRIAAGHAGKDEPRFMRRNRLIQPWEMGDLMRPVGGLYSTAEDLLLFCRANFGKPDDPLKEGLEDTRRVRIETPEEGVGLGWSVNYFDQRSIKLHYKHGMVSGYSAYVGLNVKAHLAVVVLSTNFEWEDRVGHNLLLRLSRYYAGLKNEKKIPESRFALIMEPSF